MYEVVGFKLNSSLESYHSFHDVGEEVSNEILLSIDGKASISVYASKGKFEKPQISRHESIVIDKSKAKKLVEELLEFFKSKYEERLVCDGSMWQIDFMLEDGSTLEFSGFHEEPPCLGEALLSDTVRDTIGFNSMILFGESEDK